MMCRPCDLISLTFWGKSCLSHMGHASSNCTIHLLRHGSMLHPKGVFVIMVGDNWDNTYTYIYIYTLWTLISLICTDMKMYMVYMLGAIYIIFQCERSFVCFLVWFIRCWRDNTIHEATIPCSPNVSVGKKCMFAQFISDGPGPRILPVCEVDSK